MRPLPVLHVTDYSGRVPAPPPVEWLTPGGRWSVTEVTQGRTGGDVTVAGDRIAREGTAGGSIGSIAERLAALDGTFAAEAGVPLLERLLEGATVRRHASGAEIHPGDDPRIGILVEGIARTYLHAWDARQMTLRHTHPGNMLGKSSGARGRGLRLRIEAETPCVVVELDRPHYFHVLESEPRLAARVQATTVALLNAMYDTLAVNVFGTVRERLAYALLEHASRDDTGRILVHSTQQELADDIGSTREVVSRALRDLASSGLLMTAKGVVVLLDPDGLARSLSHWIDPASRQLRY